MQLGQEHRERSVRAEPDGLVVGSGVVIPWHELEFHAIPGGGPGGQHVNRSATRVILRWNLLESPSVPPAQRTRLQQRLGKRLAQDGTVRVVAGEYRSRWQNRQAAFERLQQLLQRALFVPPARKATRPTRGSVERRLASKHLRGETKRQRRRDVEE